MKTCRDCHLEKPLTDFYAHPQMADGTLNICKECVKVKVRRRAVEKAEYIRAYDRGRSALPHRVRARAKYAKTEAGRAAMRRANRKYEKTELFKQRRAEWIGRNREKRHAHIVVGNAIATGRLTRKPCARCGVAKVHAHHANYAKPLQVRWLCVKHHQQLHRRKRNHS